MSRFRDRRVHFISDGSVLINSLYDPEFASIYSGMVPENDNRKWILDVVAEASDTER